MFSLDDVPVGRDARCIISDGMLVTDFKKEVFSNTFSATGVYSITSNCVGTSAFELIH